MPQRCRVCSHSETQEIEEKIVQGMAHTKIAAQYEGLDNQNIRRHAKNHLPEKLVKATQDLQKEHSEDMLSTIQELLDTSRDILDEALEDDQKTTALSAIRESRNTVELMARIAKQLEDYRRQDEEKKDSRLHQQASEGLQSLSDEELITLIQLTAKVHANNPDHQLDPETRMVVEYVNSNRFNVPSTDTDFGTSYQEDSSRSNSVRNRSRQAKNTESQKEDSTEEVEDFDLDLDDLDLDEDSKIPSEEDDPDWLKEERKRRNRSR